jgi:hypothetical protein
MSDALKQAIEKLYLAFNLYEIDNLNKTSCFDYGPTPEELSGISKSLRDIPDNIMARMEFFAYGWDSWGTKNEVGYFLPRLMMYLADDVDRLDDPGFFSLFKYKLRDLFSDANEDWTDKQKENLFEFFTVLLEEHLSDDIEVDMLIECALALDLAPQIIFSHWNTDEQTRKKQVVAILKHFRYSRATPKGQYFDDSERIKIFLELLVEQLTPEEVAEIY